MTTKTLIALALLAPAAALANGYSVPNVNARDLGMAGSLVAAQRDAAATFGNPAALSKLPEGLNLSLSASMLDLESTWTSPDASQTNSMRFRPAPPPALYAAWGGKLDGRGWGVGVGMTIPAGGNVFWPEEWPGRFRIVEVDRKVYGTYLTGGLEILPQLRLGGGLAYYRTVEKLVQKIDFLTSEGSAELGAAGGKLSYDLALEAQPVLSVPLVIGVDYKERAIQTLKGKAHFDGVPADLAGQLIDQKVEHVLPFPRTLNVGASYRPTSPLLVTFTFTYDWYEDYKDDTFKGEFATTCPSAVCVVVPRSYRNGYTFRFGGEYALSDRLEVRLGLLRDISGQRTDFFSPTLPDGSTWAFTGGASWKFMPNLAGTLGLFYAPFDKVTATGTEAFGGSYKTSAFVAAASIVWNRPPPPAQ
jgi:long-chain fatty acid transport protein